MRDVRAAAATCRVTNGGASAVLAYTRREASELRTISAWQLQTCEIFVRLIKRDIRLLPLKHKV